MGLFKKLQMVLACADDDEIAHLHAAVVDATGLRGEAALVCAQLVLRVLVTQRAVDSQLQNDGDGFNDC